MNKLFIVNSSNKYSNFGLNSYKKSFKIDSDSSFLINKKFLKKNHFKNIDVIVTNEKNQRIFKSFKSKIYFLINQYSEKNQNKFFDFQIDPYLKNNFNLNIYRSNLIKFDDNFYEDFFDVIKILKWDSDFWGKKTATILTPIINQKNLHKNYHQILLN
jgi:hypothetical protein